jgi:hypothetical protein
MPRYTPENPRWYYYIYCIYIGPNTPIVSEYIRTEYRGYLHAQEVAQTYVAYAYGMNCVAFCFEEVDYAYVQKVDRAIDAKRQTLKNKTAL